MTGALLLAVLAGMTIVPAGTAEARPSPLDAPIGSSTMGADTGRFVSGVFESMNGTRVYKLYVPGSFDKTKRQMLVVMLHGCTQDADDIARGTQLNEAAERDGFLVLYPEQPSSANPKKCWNWYDPAHQRRDAGEPAIIAGLTTRTMRDYAIDDARVYLAGVSAGGAMATQVAAAYPELFAALMLHSSPPFSAATNVVSALQVMQKGVADPLDNARQAVESMGKRKRAIPVLVVHGAKDAVVASVNGEQAALQWAATSRLATGAGVGTAPKPLEVEYGEANGYRFTRRRFHEANGHELVAFVLVEGLGHAWSGGSTTGTFTDARGPDATQLMLDFFRAHPLPRS